MAKLGRGHSYAAAFEAAQAGNSKHAFAPPWPKPGGQRFWHFYLDQRLPGDVSGADAWRFLVPLRWGLPSPDLTTIGSARVLSEAFVFPFGIAYLTTVTLRGDRALPDLVDEARAIQRDARFHRPGEGQPATLQVVAALAFEELREKILGPGFPAERQSIDPFTLVTVVNGTSDQPVQPLHPDSDDHRALQGLVDWSRTWKVDQLSPLQERSLSIKNASPHRVLYAGLRGRAVWFPALFLLEPKGIHTLACYHRNLLFASMQVEALCTLAAITARRIDDGLPISPTLGDCSRYAAGILGRLIGGNRSTYRTATSQAQVIDGGFKPVVDAVRRYHGMQSVQ